MVAKFYCSLVSLLCFLYAKHLNQKDIEKMSEPELKVHFTEVAFYTLFGFFALILSFY